MSKLVLLMALVTLAACGSDGGGGAVNTGPTITTTCQDTRTGAGGGNNAPTTVNVDCPDNSHNPVTTPPAP